MKMKNRHTIIRIIVALFWIAVGIIEFIRADVKMALFSIAIGILYAVGAFMRKKKG